jgi:hypothetical protein
MRRIIAPLISVLAITGIAVGSARPTVASVPADTLYGSALVDLGDPGVHSIATIDQNDGSNTWLEPQAVNFKGLAFDSDGRLFATDCVPYGVGYGCSLSDSPSLLMELDPVTGAILDTIGTVTDASGFHPTIETLSVQPGTDVLYGFGGYFGFGDVEMWTIDKPTAVATFVASFGPCIPSGSTPNRRGCGRGYGFAPDGTLYHLAGHHTGEGWLIALDPSTGALISSTPLDQPTPEGATLAVRSDGTLFSSWFGVVVFPRPPRPEPPIDPLIITRPLMIIDPLTGAKTEVGGGGPFSDLAFSPSVVELIDLDIKPGSDSNPVSQSGQGKIPVAILGSDIFDVLDVDVTTLAFGPGAAAPSHDLTKPDAFEDHLRDVNADGSTDLITHYRIQEAGIEADAAEACIAGETLDGIPFEGCDSIRAVATKRRMQR